MKNLPTFVDVQEDVMNAFNNGMPVVALESTIITHGMPFPDNVEMAQSVEAEIRQRGAGMPVLRGRGNGDMVIQIEVETPTKLSKEQRLILRQFQETETGDETPNSSGFFGKLKDAWEDLTE